MRQNLQFKLDKNSLVLIKEKVLKNPTHICLLFWHGPNTKSHLFVHTIISRKIAWSFIYLFLFQLYLASIFHYFSLSINDITINGAICIRRSS